MRLHTLSLLNFRNLVTPALSFSEGITAVVGPNAAGKSNLLHAVYLGLTGELPGGRIAESVRLGQEEGYVATEVEHHQGRNRVEVGLAPGRKALKLNGQFVRAYDISRVSTAVLITPEDADLIHGSPSGRRGYLDSVLSKLSVRYAAILREYNRVVEQRNACLKVLGGDPTLEVWTDRFLELGLEVEALRVRAVTRIGELADEVYRRIAGPLKSLDILLRRPGGEASLPEALASSRLEEQARGTTVVGPHRDDLELALDGNRLQAYGSRGEARTAALALRVAEYRLLCEKHREAPVLLLDDFTAELDAARSGYLLGLAGDTPQALVSGTEPPSVAGAALRIDGGVVLVA